MTTPSVPYRILLRKNALKERTTRDFEVTNPADWVERHLVDKYLEPMVRGTIITPET